MGAPQAPSSANAFAQAKDIAARQGNKALEALRDQMTKRGISDSGIAASGEAGILGGIAQQASRAAYDTAEQDVGRQWEAAQTGYRGDITQRGQDLNTYLSLLSKLMY